MSGSDSGQFRNTGTLLDIESIEIHDLVPRGHEVAHEFLLRVVARVDLREGTELGVRTEDEIDAAAGPFELARPATADLEGLLLRRIRASRPEGHLHVVSGVLCRLLNSGTPAQHDQIAKRDLLCPTGL